MKKRCFLSNLAHCPVSIPYGNVFRGYKNWILGWNGSNFSETFLEKNCILSFRKISEERQCFYQIHINMNAYNLKLYWKINSIIELKTNSIAHWDYNPQPISLLTNTQPWFSACLQNKWFWVRVSPQSLKFQMSRLFRERSFDIHATTDSRFILIAYVTW